MEFCKTHVGHNSDLGRLRLSQAEKDEIACQIAMNVPLDKILDQVRFNIGSGDLNRIDLLSRKDLRNIEQEYSLKSEAIRHKNDALSIDSWVREMETAGGIVLFYKPQGIPLETCPQFAAEDFILIIMNESQKEMLKHYGDKYVCFDSTHGLNAYGFLLTTLLVLDDLNQGFPCAFMFSNKEDSAAIEMFVSAILDASLKQTYLCLTWQRDITMPGPK